MSCDYIALASQGVQGIQPYQPGKPIEELERELGLTNIIKLASNENPMGPSEAVKAAVQNALPAISRYPDGNGFELKQALSSQLGVGLDQLTLGNGSNDVLELLGRAYLTPSAEVVYSQHSFAVYPLVTQATGAKAVVTPAKDYGHDLEAMAEAVTDNTRLIFVANPNNPTGTWVNRQTLEAFLARIPETTIVVLDEAYTEYVTDPDYPNGLDYLAQYPNLVVTRTFSKAYGLSGLRVGYAVSNPQIADVLNRVRQPFNTNALAQAAAVAALGDQQYMDKSVALNTQGLQQLQQGFDELGLKAIPSVANFIAVDMGREAQPVYEALLKQGVIVRPIAGYGMPNFLRVSVGLPEENDAFLKALKTVL